MRTYVFHFCFGDVINRDAVLKKRIRAVDYAEAMRIFVNAPSIFIIEIKEETLIAADESSVQNISNKVPG